MHQYFMKTNTKYYFSNPGFENFNLLYDAISCFLVIYYVIIPLTTNAKYDNKQ